MMRKKNRQTSATVGRNKIKILDETLQRERKRKRVLGKAQFREKLLRDKGRLEDE